LGEEQKSLITAVLAKRLNALAQLKEKFIEQVLPGFAVVTLEEGVFPCEKMIFATCFSSAEGGYARGISPRIAEKLGTDCSTALAAILRAPKSDLTVTCAFSPEELHNTRMFIESVESFKSFMTRLFFMSGLAFPHSLEKGDDPIIESVYEHLCKKGFTLYKNCGFSRFKTDLLLIDGQTPCRVAALITGDKSFKKLCDDPRKAQLWISGFYKAGVEIFYISDACWFGDKQDTLKKLEEFCRRVLNTDLSDPIEESYEGV
jgi:hypothetical protein